ncbi:LysR family transcriptional regulator [Litorisediminicola beolgyonensis]|uniref:LysR family transcriptional regulator n=1 Tax=Litorisediminicola beolgyonensis TaxID=1173614 RepID=A0ABW3ZKH9_9RHOB
MKKHDPMSVDFAALRVLQLVLSYGSFSRAAEALEVTQSSVSYTVDRLRKVFGDPLFVRQGAGIVATDRCQEIVATAARMIDEFSALSAPTEFDPWAAEDEIVLSCNYYERVTLLPGLVRRLRRDAPGIRLKVISSAVRGKEQLDRGESELLIGPIRLQETGFFGRVLLRDVHVIVMAEDHPLAGSEIDLKTFLGWPQAVVNYGVSWRSRIVQAVAEMGHEPNTVIEVPSPAHLPRLIEGTDLIATVPSRIAQSFGPVIAVVPCPVEADLEVHLFWTERTHRAPMHQWLRGQIAEVAQETGPDTRGETHPVIS